MPPNHMNYEQDRRRFNPDFIVAAAYNKDPERTVNKEPRDNAGMGGWVVGQGNYASTQEVKTPEQIAKVFGHALEALRKKAVNENTTFVGLKQSPNNNMLTLPTTPHNAPGAKKTDFDLAA